MGTDRPLPRTAALQDFDILPRSGVGLIPLPVNSLGSIVAKSVASPVVTVTQGQEADVPLRYNYWAGTKIVTIEMNLHFAPGSVSEPKDVCIGLDLHSFIVDFSPAIDHFKHEVRFSVQASNLDLSAVPDGAHVYFMNLSDAQCEIIPADTLHYDKGAGTLTLVDARLSHFSVYGFGFIK